MLQSVLAGVYAAENARQFPAGSHHVSSGEFGQELATCIDSGLIDAINEGYENEWGDRHEDPEVFIASRCSGKAFNHSQVAKLER